MNGKAYIQGKDDQYIDFCNNKSSPNSGRIMTNGIHLSADDTKRLFLAMLYHYAVSEPKFLKEHIDTLYFARVADIPPAIGDDEDVPF